MPVYETSKTKAGVQFSKSVGGAVKTLFSGKVSFEIEHLSPSKNYQFGQKSVISTQYAKLGRSAKCDIIFDYDDFPYVSSEHAAIEFVSGRWVLKHLSKTNPTLVNGVAIKGEYFIQHGDIFRLAFEGPEMKFLLPASDTPKVALSSRTAMLRKQIAVHYKVFVPVFILLFICVAALGYYIIKQNQKIEDLEQSLYGQKISKEEAIAAMDSLNSMNEKKLEELSEKNKTEKPTHTRPRPQPKTSPEPINNDSITPTNKDTLKSDISTSDNTELFLVNNLKNDILDFQGNKIKLRTEKKTEELDKSIQGVGFFVTDGKSKWFLTTREMIAPWDYFDTTSSDSYNWYFNFNQMIYSANPRPEAEVVFNFTQNGTVFKNLSFSIDTTPDQYYRTTGVDGSLFLQKRGLPSNNWAISKVIPAGHNIKIQWDPDLTLAENDTLYICALSTQGIIPDMCLFKNMGSAIETLKCTGLETYNGAPVVYIKRKSGLSPQVFVVGMVTGYPDKSYIIPVKSFINK